MLFEAINILYIVMYYKIGIIILIIENLFVHM